MTEISATGTSDSWSEAMRDESSAGELRLNAIRAVALVLFYGRHLIEYFAASATDEVRGDAHTRVTAIVLVWATSCVITHILLSRRICPPAMKYLTAVFDALMITMVCAVAGGPRTPRVVLYFLLIAAAPLRLSLGLVYASAAAAMLGYLFLLAHYAWYVVGFHRYYASPELRIPRAHEALMLLGLLTAGFLAGQVVRQVRRLVGGGDRLVVAVTSAQHAKRGASDA